jgi:hypothetical protein
VVTLAPASADVAVSGIGQAITIEPVNPDVYYVPVYNPAVLYGAWDYPSRPPFYWSPPGFVADGAVSFVAGVTVGTAIWGDCDWWHNNVIISVNRFNVFNRTNIDVTSNIWTHNPAHRGDVPHRNTSVAARFGGVNNAATRGAFRDRAAAQHDDVFRNRADTLPGQSLLPRRIGVMVTSIGAQIVRCRSGKSLRGHAATPGPKPCGHAPKPSGRSDAPSAAAFASAAVDGVGSEP